MTRAWVVYESMFGNTRKVAEAVAEGLGSWTDVELHEVSAANPLPHSLDLLVVGGPTHAFGLSRSSTRKDAAQKAQRPVESPLVGVREWLEQFGPASPPPAFATFDTRVSHPRVPGSAAKKAAKRLRRLGLPEVAPPASFWVHGTEGPLLDGEVDRARDWARDLAEVVGGLDAGRPVA